MIRVPLSQARIVEAELTWIGDAFVSGLRVEVGEDGRIARVAPVDAGGGGDASRAESPGPVLRLPGRALLPGLINSHSHAFQRGLRGRGESFPRGQGSFWTWREAMYDLVASLDEMTLHRLSLQAFREMRAAGTTTVGEFHYVHHVDPDQTDFRLDEVVIAAAAEAGIRLVLLQTYYRTGAIGQPLAGAQRRFATPSPAVYWQQMDRLGACLDPRQQSLGAVVHSLRAGGPEDLAAIYAEARRRDLVFHIHVEEQRREIEDAIAFYGMRPMEILWETLGTAADLTAIHCTHTTAEDLERFLAAGGRVCACPLTEGNLGDGIPGLDGIPGIADGLCLGSDSNARISPLEEMRWLEYGQRLRGEKRGGLRELAGPGRVAPVLFRAATEGGARALGIEAGAIEPGRLADFAAVDLADPSLAETTAETLLEALVFGAGDAVIAGTAVGGEWEIKNEG